MFDLLAMSGLATAWRPLIILDVDGVIFDSNRLKSDNIYEAALKVCGAERAATLRDDFVMRSGVPREVKIAEALGAASPSYQAVLSAYNALNADTLMRVPLTPDAEAVLAALSAEHTLVAMSGADERELHRLFNQRGLMQYFEVVRGGPLDKVRNLAAFVGLPALLYVGDALADQHAACHYGVPFCYMSGYAATEPERMQQSGLPIAYQISNLAELPAVINACAAPVIIGGAQG